MERAHHSTHIFQLKMETIYLIIYLFVYLFFSFTHLFIPSGNSVSRVLEREPRNWNELEIKKKTDIFYLNLNKKVIHLKF